MCKIIRNNLFWIYFLPVRIVFAIRQMLNINISFSTNNSRYRKTNLVNTCI